jgi:hypothetical protein
MEDPRVLDAARYGYLFGTDVLTVLDSDRFAWRLRMAALGIYLKDHAPPKG